MYNNVLTIESSSSPFAYTNVQCIGLEKGLSNCLHDDDTSSCDQTLIASAVCTDSEVPQVSVRLSGGSSDLEGRLEILFAGIWGVVCFNGWDQEEGNVACNQLGLKSLVESYGMTPPLGVVSWLGGVSCGGSESTLAHCSHSGWGQSLCSSSVWLRCGGNVSRSQLVNVTTPHSPIPMACKL